MRHHDVPASLPIALLLMAAAPTMAFDDVPWISGSGTYATGSNWGGGAPPAAADRAIMDLSGSRTISFSANHAASQARVAHGSWTWNLSGRTYSLTSPEASFLASYALQVGYQASDFANFFIDGPGSVSAVNGVFGMYDSSSAFVTVRNNAVVVLDRLEMGEAGGFGSLIVRDGGRVAADELRMSFDGGSTMLVTAGGHLTMGLGILGGADDTSINVNDGLVECYETLNLSASTINTTTVTLHDPAAEWICYAVSRIGYLGTASVEVSDGSFFYGIGTVNVGDTSTADGVLEVGTDGPGTFWYDSFCVVGGTTGGVGRLTVGPGGVVDGLDELRVGDTGTVELLGGSLIVDNFKRRTSTPGTFSWTDGLLWLRADFVDFDDNASMLGPQRELQPGQTLEVEGQLRIHDELPGFAYLDFAGGTLQAEEVLYGPFTGTRGESWVTDGTIEAQGLVGVAWRDGVPVGEGDLRLYEGGIVDAGQVVVGELGTLSLPGADGLLRTPSLVVAGGTVDSQAGEILVTSDLFAQGVDGLFVDGLDPVSVEVRDGGMLLTGEADIATYGGGRGAVIVRGQPKTEWIANGRILLGTLEGSANEARLRVEGPGRVVAPSMIVSPDARVEMADNGTILALLTTVGGTLAGDGRLEGDLALSPPAQVEVTVRGGGLFLSDEIVVTGDAELEGTLRIVATDGASAGPGDAVRILRVDGVRTGAFDEVVLEGIPLDVTVQYLSDGVYVVGAGSNPADVDGDGDVDIEDLLAVLAAWGDCSGCPEDIDGDGVVAINDLLAVLAGWSG